MKRISRSFFLFVILALALSSCTAGQPAEKEMTDSKPMAEPTKTLESMPMDKPTESMMGKPTEAAIEKPTEAMQEMAMPNWFSAPLEDVRSMQTFTIGQFKGKVVLVEMMAIWCTKCLQQQKQVQALHGLLAGRDDFISIGLDIDPNENAADLKAYVESRGFDWLYGVAPAGLSRELGELYGGHVLNPTATPLLIIDRHGEAHLLPPGIKSAEELLAIIQPFLDDSM